MTGEFGEAAKGQDAKLGETIFNLFGGLIKTTLHNLYVFDKGEQSTITTTRHKRNISFIYVLGISPDFMFLVEVCNF